MLSLSALSACLPRHAAIVEVCDLHALHAIIVFLISPVSLSALAVTFVGSAMLQCFPRGVLLLHVQHQNVVHASC